MRMLRCVVLLVSAAALAAAQETTRKIAVKGVRVTGDDGEAVLTLDLDGPARYEPHILENPDRFYVDVFGSHAASDLSVQQDGSRSLVRQVRIGATEAPSSGITRVVFDLTGPVNFTLASDAAPNQILFTLQSGDTAKQSLPQIAQNQPIPTAPVALAVDPKTGSTASSQTDRSITIGRIATPPKLDTFLNNRVPTGFTAVSDFRQREPGDGQPASLGTTAYLGYDDKNLYVVFVCKDEPGQVRGRMSKREDISEDDTVTLYLDSFHDTQRAYYFTVNPLGIQSDGFILSGKTDNRFDTLWYSDGRVTDDGYMVSMTIPFKSLRFLNTEQQVWGIALGRSIIRKNERSFWPYITRRQTNFLRQLGDAMGMSSISPGRNIQLIPYAAYRDARLSRQEPNRYLDDREFRAGLDAKVVVHDSLTLDLTVNPDFSQVESDDPQLTANQRFEVFYPEKRPFFIENINYFETPLNLLFTRRISDPQYGARLTGKLGSWNLGAMVIDDRAPGLLAPSNSPISRRRSITGAARLQKVFRQDSNFGVLLTERQVGDVANHIQSADMRLRLTPTLYFTGQAAHSSDRSLNSALQLKDSTGNAYHANLSYADRHFSYDSTYRDLGAGFRAPGGFVPRVGIRSLEQYAGYLFWPEGKLLSHGPSADVIWTWDRSGRLLDRYTTLDYRMDFIGPVGFSIGHNDSYEYFLGQGLHYRSLNGSFYGNWIKSFTFYGNFGLGTGANYSTPTGVAPYVGGNQTGNAGFTWRPTQRLRLEEYYYFNRLTAPTGVAGPETAAVNNHISRTKLNVQFTKALSIRAIVDYYFLSPNQALFASDRYKQLTGDILLTYLLNPGTAIYIGYNNRYENLAIDPDAPASLRRFGAPDYLTERQLFVKLSYLFRF